MIDLPREFSILSGSSKMKLFLSLIMMVSGVAASAATRTKWDGVLDIVDNTVISKKDRDNEMQVVFNEYQRLYANDPQMLEQKLRIAERDIIEQLIDRQLILRDFKTQGYN